MFKPHKQPKLLLFQVPLGDVEVNGYVSADGVWSLRREHGETPNGNSVAGRWVLRRDGEYVDHGSYRNDMVEHHNLELMTEDMV